MVETPVPPFSSRNRGPHAHVVGDFPTAARHNLLHLLHDLMEKEYIGDWRELARELRRILREKPYWHNDDNSGRRDAQIAGEQHLLDMPWDKMFDFCERLHSHLAKAVVEYSVNEESHVILARSKVQDAVASELQRLFLEEDFAYEFRDGKVQRRGRHHTADLASRASYVLGDPKLDSARQHYNKAQKYFQHPTQPDLENAVKEAVCAVEAAAHALFRNDSAKTLGDAVKALTGSDPGQLPKAVAQTFHGLYGFRSGGEGVGHGGAEGGAVTSGLAEYVLAVAASQIILLVDLANQENDDIPF